MNLAKAWTAQLDDYVIDLAWSPDSRLLAAASAAGPVTLLAGADGAKRQALSGHDGGTNAVAWAPAFERSEIGGQKSIPASPISDLRPPRPDLLASGGQDGCVRLWDSTSGAETAKAVMAVGEWVEQIAWRPMSGNPVSAIRNPVLAAAAGRKLRLLDAQGRVAHEFPPAPKTISALAWHPDGGAVAVAWYGGVCLWDADGHGAQKEFTYGSAIQALTWSPDGRWLVAGAQDNAVHLWIPAEGEEFHMSGYETKVRELSFSPDSRWLATGGARDACVWDCSGSGPEGREPLALPHGERVCAVAFQQAHGLLATAAGDGELSLWSPTRREPLVATVKLTAPASKLAWSPDDGWLAVGSQKGGVLVLKVEN
jgi:WD40 repeat protein